MYEALSKTVGRRERLYLPAYDLDFNRRCSFAYALKQRSVECNRLIYDRLPSVVMEGMKWHGTE